MIGWGQGTSNTGKEWNMSFLLNLKLVSSLLLGSLDLRIFKRERKLLYRTPVLELWNMRLICSLGMRKREAPLTWSSSKIWPSLREVYGNFP